MRERRKRSSRRSQLASSEPPISAAFALAILLNAPQRGAFAGQMQGKGALSSEQLGDFTMHSKSGLPDRKWPRRVSRSGGAGDSPKEELEKWLEKGLNRLQIQTDPDSGLGFPIDSRQIHGFRGAGKSVQGASSRLQHPSKERLTQFG